MVTVSAAPSVRSLLGSDEIAPAAAPTLQIDRLDSAATHGPIGRLCWICWVDGGRTPEQPC